MALWIKICGNTNVQDADAAVAAGANAIGFIFAPGPRRIAPLDARNIVSVLPATAQRIGVFVNEKPERVREIIQKAKLTAVQLHGDEDIEYIRNMFRETGREKPDPGYGMKRQRDTRIFKVIRMDSTAEARLRQYHESGLVDAFLLDSATRVRGGSGQPFDWKAAASMLRPYEGKIRIIVAGGLTAENVGEAIRTLRPWGVDVVTGVEKQPGIKSREAMYAFVDAVRAAEEGL
jgi:phosphoribosylanthranilate isomerase